MDLTRFLTDRLAEDEAAAKAVQNAEREPWQDDDWQDQHEADQAMAHRFSSARVLREVEAKRKILDLHEQARAHKNGRLLDFCICQAEDGVVCGRWPCETLRAFAAIWSDHPDYDPAWKE